MILLHNAEHAGQGGKLLAGHFGGAPGDNDGHAGRFALEAAYGLPCVGHGIGGDGARIERGSRPPRRARPVSAPSMRCHASRTDWDSYWLTLQPKVRIQKVQGA